MPSGFGYLPVYRFVGITIGASLRLIQDRITLPVTPPRCRGEDFAREAGEGLLKKLINDPFDVVEEMVEGYLAANDHIIKRVGKRSIARANSPIPGKVGIVVGGG